MPHFFVDDAFADSKEVMSIPDSYRNAAVGLWVRCGAWSANKLTDGFIPDDVLKMFGGRATKQLVALLVESTLWERVEGGIVFRNWMKWQRSRDQVESYRAWNREKQRRHREKVKDSTSDDAESDPERNQVTNRGSNQKRNPTPVPVPERTTQVGLEHSPNVGGDERGLTEPVSPSASRLVAVLIPDTFPSAVRTGLRLKASELMNRDQIPADDIADALRLWLAKPDSGPGLLPHLVAEAQRARTAPTPTANGRRRPTTDERIARLQALKTPTGTKELEQ